MSYSNDNRLLEREAELAEVAGAIEEASTGSGRLLVLQAPAGLGKTSLVGRACRYARDQGVRVLSARGSELESSFPFGIVRQLFEPQLAAGSAEEREAWLAGAAQLVRPMFEDLMAVDEAADDASFPRLHGLYWLSANLARDRPLLLSVDDAHWADEPSLKYLGFLARRLEELPILLLVGTRPNEEALSPLLPQLVADPFARLVRPDPLSDEAIDEWVRGAVGEEADSEFCGACHAATGGNPLLMSELLREVASERISPTADQAARVAALGPQGVSTVVLLRLARMPPAAPELARAVAVLGDSASVAAAAELAGLEESEAAATGSALVRAEVLTQESDGLSFVHPIVRTAIYEDMPHSRRLFLHARAAEVLSRRNCTPEEVAAQLLATQPADQSWVVEILREAARRSLKLGDSAQAVAYLDRALAEPPADDRRAAVLSELGRAEARTGAPEAAWHLRTAMDLAPDPRAAAEAAIELAGLLKFAGESVEAVDVLEEAAERLGSEEGDLAERLEVELINAAMISMEARPLLADRIARLQDPGGAPRTFLERATLSALAFNGFAECRPADEVADRATRALAGGDLPTDPVSGGHAFVSAVIALMFAERYDEAEQLYTEALEDARRRGSAVSFATASSLRSLVYYRRGRLADAYADAGAALDLAGDVQGSQGFLAAALGTKIYVSLDRGAVDEELEQFADAFLVEQADDNLPYSHAMHSRACLRVLRGDLRQGLDEILASGRRELAWGAPNPAITPWRSTGALVHAQLGEGDEARRLALEEVELARRFGAPRCLGVALRAAGVVTGGDEGMSLLREAVEVLADSAGRLEHARALIDLGGAMRRAGNRSDAREHLRAGQDQAARCGATRIVEQAQEELIASGARPRRTALSGADSLTPSERRVAEMAAQGMTNRDIAQALFVTEKTVETHLGHVYGKLNVQSRRQLGGALSEAVPA